MLLLVTDDLMSCMVVQVPARALMLLVQGNQFVPYSQLFQPSQPTPKKKARPRFRLFPGHVYMFLKLAALSTSSPSDIAPWLRNRPLNLSSQVDTCPDPEVRQFQARTSARFARKGEGGLGPSKKRVSSGHWRDPPPPPSFLFLVVSCWFGLVSWWFPRVIGIRKKDKPECLTLRRHRICSCQDMQSQGKLVEVDSSVARSPWQMIRSEK